MARCVLALVVVGLTLLGPADRARACAAPVCLDSVVLPAGTSADPALVPANAAFVSVALRAASATGAAVSAERTRAGSTTTFALGAPGVLPLPDAQEGDVFVVTESHDCNGSAVSFTTTIRITASATLPTTLGTLSIAAPMRRGVTVPDGSGPCTSPIDSVVADYDVALDAANAPWIETIEQTTYVDGAPWYEPTWPAGTGSPPTPPPPGSRFVYAACAVPTPGQAVLDLDEGDHVVRVEGRVRGTSTTVTTSEEHVTLRCAVGTDAGLGADAGAGASTGGGCGCALAARAPVSIASCGLGLLVLASLARRRVDRDREARRRLRAGLARPSERTRRAS